MSLKSKLGAAAVTAVLIAGAALAAASPASANNGVEICAYYVNGLNVNVPESPCANAYGNGGALIKSYGPGATWEDIYVQATGGTFQLYDANTGGCLGDANNDPNDARVGDNLRCPSQGSAGWGTVFQFVASGCPNNGGVFFNNHWRGNMIGGVANGSQWYLNTANYGCLFDFQ